MIVAVFVVDTALMLPSDAVVVNTWVVVVQPEVCDAVPVTVYQPLSCPPSQPAVHGPQKPQAPQVVGWSWFWTPDQHLEYMEHIED